jgi:LPXTG-motif cell wall-anchored protein
VKRSCHDEKTIDQFDSLLVDGVKVDESAYGKKAGSVILTLSPEFLETLDTGEHVLSVVFADADPAEASFKVLEKEQQEPEESTEENTEEQESTGDNEGGDSGNTGGNDKKSQNAKTGDDTPIVPLGILMSISLLAMGGIMVYKRKRKD